MCTQYKSISIVVYQVVEFILLDSDASVPLVLDAIVVSLKHSLDVLQSRYLQYIFKSIVVKNLIFLL